jgi:hypothetical protein
MEESMSDTNYTISMMFRETTHWNAYPRDVACALYEYAHARMSEGDDHYGRLERALLAQHCVFSDGTIGFPLKVVARFDAYRKKLKKEGTEVPQEYAAVLSLAFDGASRATNGLEVRQVKMKVFARRPSVGHVR